MYKECTISELQHLIATRSNEHAYAELFNRFAPALNAFARTMVHQPQVAEEIVSDVFIRIWLRRQSLDQVSNLKMYLYVSVRNFSINHLRSVNNKEVFDLEQIPDELIQLNVPNPLQITSARQLHQQIIEAIATLPPKCKIIYKLAKEDGMRIKEIAELLHIAPKTVENQLTIAVKKMAASIKGITDKVIKLRS